MSLESCPREKSIGSASHIGSSAVIATGLIIIVFFLLGLGRLVGWDETWRSFNVTPLQPHFFDMHVLTDYAACAAKGFDAYVPHSCNPDNFNTPPIWLWLGYLGVDASDSTWLSIVMITAALLVVLVLFRGRSVRDGILALAAIVSPSVMMGVERANSDLLILTLVGAAAIAYEEKRIGRLFSAGAILALAIVLKLFPMFCVAVGAKFTRRVLVFSGAMTLLSMIYLAVIFSFILLIRRNVPTTFMLSYGYKTIFLGFDYMRTEARLNPVGLADTWLPMAMAVFVLIFAAGAAFLAFRNGRSFCAVTDSMAGTAFLFGSGIYCGTFLLGTNFIYRLMFLLLCLPQLMDWRVESRNKGARTIIESSLLVAVLSVLWLNGDANGHTTFLLVPQLIDWLLFFALAGVLFSNFLTNAFARSVSGRTIIRGQEDADRD